MSGIRRGYLRFLEMVGIRGIYVFTANSVQEPILPPVKLAPQERGWSEAQLYERRSGSRYFSWANILRTVLHLPVIGFGVFYNIALITWIFGFLAVGHILLTIVESYKAGIVEMIPVDEEGSHIDHFVPANFYEWWFSPKFWESEKLYQILGLRVFQHMTTYVISLTRLTRHERKQGQKVEYLGQMTPTQVLRFEVSTRVGEIVHGVMGLVDLIPLILAIQMKAHWGWVLYMIWILWGDISLGFLQRYHRLRIWKFVSKCRERVERKAKLL